MYVHNKYNNLHTFLITEYSDMAKILEKCFKKSYKKHVPPDPSDLDSSDEEFAESKRWKKPADKLPSRAASRPTRAASSRAREALLYAEMGGVGRHFFSSSCKLFCLSVCFH